MSKKQFVAAANRLPEIVAQVQVNVPCSQLVDRYLPVFLEKGLNPEIGIDAVSLERFRRGDFEAVARQFQGAGRRITLHGPFHDLLPGALDGFILEATRRRLRQAFSLVEVFRPASIVCHAGYEARHFGAYQEQWLTASVATWRELADLAAPYGTVVMLENVYETEPDILVRLLTRVERPNVQFCLDVGHLQAFGNGDFPQWLTALGPRVGQLHLHDNAGDEDEHRALGTGTVPVAMVLSSLAAQGCRPIVTLEPHQANSLEPSLQYLSDIWPW